MHPPHNLWAQVHIHIQVSATKLAQWQVKSSPNIARCDSRIGRNHAGVEINPDKNVLSAATTCGNTVHIEYEVAKSSLCFLLFLCFI